MSDPGGWFCIIAIVLGFFMTFHRHLVGRIVGLILVVGPFAVLIADDWFH